jgi:hypothetical protein
MNRFPRGFAKHTREDVQYDVQDALRRLVLQHSKLTQRELMKGALPEEVTGLLTCDLATYPSDILRSRSIGVEAFEKKYRLMNRRSPSPLSMPFELGGGS